jgi:hypothetical protein
LSAAVSYAELIFLGVLFLLVLAAEPTQFMTAAHGLLEWAGVSLGLEESYRLGLALKHLAHKFSARELRFWGKIQGLEGDYVIAEGEVDDEGEDDSTDAWGNAIEKTGSGANKYKYWVARFAGDDWVQLPNVTPQQVIVARQLRRYLTGRLDAPVGGHPPFPGKEAAYLRARIAIISADTVLAPSGVFVASEEEGSNDIAKNEEEFDAPDLSALDGWVHQTLSLNALGRTKPNPPKVGADGEEIADPDAPEPSAALRPVSEDAEGTWALRGYPRTATVDGDAPRLVSPVRVAWLPYVTFTLACAGGASQHHMAGRFLCCDRQAIRERICGIRSPCSWRCSIRTDHSWRCG